MWVAGLCAWMWSIPVAAQVDVFSDFQTARTAYFKHDYTRAIRLFESLVGGPSPRVENRALRLESRKYLGASYLFEKRRDDAVQQFTLLLREDPSYRLDPVSFPAEVLSVFASVQQQVNAEIKANQERAGASGDRDSADPIAPSRVQRMQTLIDLAETERIERHNSRWIAMLPFGAGQFQNGHTELGTALAVSQGILAAMSILSFIVYQTIEIPTQLVGQPPSSERQAAQDAEQAWYYTNLASTALFVVLATAGIIDAQIRYEPHVQSTRRRALPAELREGITQWSSQENHTLVGKRKAIWSTSF